MSKPSNNLILISAFGNVELILECIDFFNGGNRFSYDAEATQLRNSFAADNISEIHLICTEGVRDKFQELEQKAAEEYPEISLYPFFLNSDDICTRRDEKEMKERVYTLVHKLAGENSRVIISSGGRKTMTNRLIEAGILYGCEGYLAITAPHQSTVTGDIRKHSELFNVLWIPARRFYEERRHNDIREGIGDNFRSLYVLPQAVIEKLQREKVGLDVAGDEKELKWLSRLPKADLHCHLGGAFDSSLLRTLAQQMVKECGIDIQAVQQEIETKIGCPLSRLTSTELRKLNPEAIHCLKNLGLLFNTDTSQDGIPALVACLTEEQIRELSFDGREVSSCTGMDLNWYMACGDLGGSALLQTERCLRTALSWLLEQACTDGVQYIEVRCSPENYCRRGLGLEEVLDILIDEGAGFMRSHPGYTVNFLVMATRHKSQAAMSHHVSAAVCYASAPEAKSKQALPRVVGFDLAGQEKDHDPVKYKELFMPLHHHFVNITIHAGEMEEDDKIWQALYLLHAKRIGHGLKLINNKKMMNYIRDYGTAIEMCPSSNLQTNNFKITGQSEDGAVYPLQAYLEHGIAVTINTDNPGISDTRLSREYWLAARLSEDGLSRWQILKLIKNSFRAAFLPKDKKDQLLKDMDKKVFDLIINDYFPGERS